MKVKTALAALAAFSIVASAQAQTTTTPAPAATTPTAPVAASSCAAFTPAPSPPDGASASQRQVNDAVAGFEVWRVNEQTVMDCRRAEVAALNAQLAARTEEYRTATADNTARGAAFQAQLDIFNARGNRRR